MDSRGQASRLMPDMKYVNCCHPTLPNNRTQCYFVSELTDLKMDFDASVTQSPSGQLIGKRVGRP